MQIGDMTYSIADIKEEVRIGRTKLNCLCFTDATSILMHRNVFKQPLTI